jgi:adenylate kinase family enzyme
MRVHVHIFGASGAGTSTLGLELAQRRGMAFVDTDDVFWEPTDPPYQRSRERGLRQRMLMEELATRDRWVLAGSLCGWGDAAIPLMDLAVFVLAPVDIRIARLQAREQLRFGDRIRPGGDMYDQHRSFLDWARRYDEGSAVERSRRLHEDWIALLSCPVIRVDGARPVDELCGQISKAMQEPRRPAPPW